MATRIGVFFDGTGNNMWNDMAIGDGSQSNIAKLYQLYKGDKKIYAEGVGTEAYTKNYNFATIDEAAAPGEEKIIGSIWDGKAKTDYYKTTSLAFGVNAKDMVEEKLDEIEEYIKNHPNEEIIIDVFGFSRGATQARDFVNEINKRYVSTNSENGSIVGFVGLFDTVATIGLANETNYGFNLDLNENSAQKIVHITAADEIRSNFPVEYLADSQSHYSSNMTEEQLRGAHSDIGGGYGVLDMKKDIIIGDRIDDTYSDEQEGLDKIAILQADAEAKGYRLEYTYEYDDLQDNGWVLEAYVVQTKEIGFGLSNVALQEMYGQITNAGIPMADLNTLGHTKDKAGNLYSNYAVPSGYVEDYIHISASDTWYDKSFGDWIANSAAPDGKRVSFRNEPDKAQDYFQSFDKYDRTFMKMSEESEGIIFGEPISRSELGAAGFSDQYIEDRVKFFYYLLDQEGRYEPLGSDATVYIDGEKGVSLSNLWFLDWNSSNDRVLFDDNFDDPFQATLSTIGDEGDDHIFGRGGDDILLGGKAKDYLEGGEGKDRLYGGEGDDTLGGNTTNDLTKATPQDDILILTDDNDTMDALAGNDYVEGKGGDDILIGNEGNDILWGGADDDMLYGDTGKDILFGDTGRDYLEGGEGEDLLYGGEGDDILLGGEGADYLDGGSGFDTYVADNGDTLSDSDGAGVVYFKNSDLTGVKTLKDGSGNIYEDKNGFTYEQSGSTLLVTHESSGESITILEWSKEKNLGIVLQESSDIDVSIDDADAREAAQSMTIEVEILRPLQGNEIYHNLVINNYANLNKQDTMINRIYKKVA